MANVATMYLRHSKAPPTKADDTRRGNSIATVDDDDDLQEILDINADIKTIARLLALKSVELSQLQRTHDEYVKSSCEYEKELETEVDRYEKKMLQLEQAALQLDRDKTDLSTSVGTIKDELQSVQRREHMMQTQIEEMKWKIQRLEQSNDELETASRIAQATIEDLQHKSDTLLEQNIFLQHEKEEVLRQLSSIVIAEVHPTPSSAGSTTLTTRSASDRLSRKSSHYVVDIPTSPPPPQENTRNGKKRKGRRPEVLETCLHLTCRKCRANKPHRHNGGSDERGSIGDFFERLRVFLFGAERLLDAKPCTTSQLTVFNAVSRQVNQCIHDSKLDFSIPPRSSLSKSQQAVLCKAKSCNEMIGSVDDLDIPRCEMTFDNKNVTLQQSLDKFVSTCDTTTPAPSPIKRKFESSSSGSGSSSHSPKKRNTLNVAVGVRFGTMQQLAVILTVGLLTLLS